HHFSDLSKPEFSSENTNQVGSTEGVMDVVHNPDVEHKNFDPGSCIDEASVEPTLECSKLAIEVSQPLNYDCVSDLAGTSRSIVPFVHEVSKTSFEGGGMHLEVVRNSKQNKEEDGCDWESLISDDTNLFIFDSPNDAKAFKSPHQKPLDPGTRLCTLVSECTHCETNNLQETQTIGSVGVVNQESENPLPEEGEDCHMKEIEASGDIFTGTSVNRCMNGEPSDLIDKEPVSNLPRGMRRRCLVFETAATRRKHLDDVSNSDSSKLSHPDVNIESIDKMLAPPIKTGNDSSRRILPGIGLHLNALARTSKEYKVGISHETLVSGSQLINDPSSSVSFHSLSAGQEPLNKSLAATSMERDKGPAESHGQGTEDASPASGYIAVEEINQSSPKKKRHAQRRAENAGESEGCKRCNCKKSKCLKLNRVNGKIKTFIPLISTISPNSKPPPKTTNTIKTTTAQYPDQRSSVLEVERVLIRWQRESKHERRDWIERTARKGYFNKSSSPLSSAFVGCLGGNQRRRAMDTMESRRLEKK
ncbi:hypothetical protein U1Q18_031257, partial [Sarracenia purpurea var. burkii]